MNQDQNTPVQNGQENHYYTAPDYGNPTPFAPPQRRSGGGFSVAALVLGIFGILCCCLGPVGLFCAVLALIFSLLGRNRAGFFDGLSLAGLICAIIGIALGLYMTYSYVVMLSDPTFWEAYEQAFNEALAGMEGTPTVQ